MFFVFCSPYPVVIQFLVPWGLTTAAPSTETTRQRRLVSCVSPCRRLRCVHVRGCARGQVHDRKTPSWRLDMAGIHTLYTHIMLTHTRREREERENALITTSSFTWGRKKKQPFRVITRAAATSRESADEVKSEATARRLSLYWRPKSQKWHNYAGNGISFLFFSVFRRTNNFRFVD